MYRFSATLTESATEECSAGYQERWGRSAGGMRRKRWIRSREALSQTVIRLIGSFR